MKELGSVEPRYNDEDNDYNILGDNAIQEESIAFIYGAIKKYGTDPDYKESLRKYIINII